MTRNRAQMTAGMGPKAHRSASPRLSNGPTFR